jgi:hypothetical protein
MCNRKMYIPNIDEKAPVWAFSIWSDAAGGSLVIFPSFWVYVPYGMRINAGEKYFAGSFSSMFGMYIFLLHICRNRHYLHELSGQH